MSGRKKIVILATLVAIGAAAGGGYWYTRGEDLPLVDAERIASRPLEALVSASGTVEPQVSVDISASVMGRVTRLGVNEGDRVSAGQFLLQIDPESLASAVDRGEASLMAAESARDQARVAVETARVNLDLARENLERQRELWELRLVSREVYDQAVSEVDVRETELRAREVDVKTSEQRIRQEAAVLDSAEYDLSQVTIVSPMDGIVTRRTIELGETVVVGTMNNAGTVLMTIADMSVLEAEIEVDETDIPDVRLGQTAGIEVDALPGQTYHGRVTEIGNSPIQLPGSAQNSATQATNFKVVVTLDDVVPNVRSGFTCTAEITTATRDDAIAVPIQATTVREMRVDDDGNIIDEPPADDRGGVTPTVEAFSTAQGDDLEELEGVFVLREGRAYFTPVVTGIAGERYFESLSGLDEGDIVITGPFSVVRELEHGDAVQLDESAKQNNDSGRGFRFRFGR